ncbi:hypothetical protein [Metabacillus idriensis]|uniref:hypothetical protein n=1 Tax=Metabacillus idriensis TaxID=324768 RepID=UPI001748983A|nr:hypothetical protein [Metabacillus idriensis]
MGNQEIFLYYLILILGVLFVLGAMFIFSAMYSNKDYSILNVGKSLGIFLLGVLFLAITLPSIKYMVLKEYDVVAGKCVIDIDSSARSSEASFRILDSDEIFTFRDIPALDAYGKSIPYYCEVTVTKDQMFEISYKIYDVKTRKLIITNQ